jgi:hypothetical protein
VNISAADRVSLIIHADHKKGEKTLNSHSVKFGYTAIFAVCVAAFGLCLTLPARAQNPSDQNSSSDSQSSKSNDNISAGFNLGKDASAKDVGLPIYPGARRHKDTSDDASALNMGLWGNSTGFKIAVLKMETSDSPEKVSAFYRKALAKYGKVLDCGAADAAAAKSSSGSNRQDSKDQTKSQQALDCGTDKPDKDGVELKSGTKEKQHVVGISKEGNVTTFQLVYIETHGLDDK